MEVRYDVCICAVLLGTWYIHIVSINDVHGDVCGERRVCLHVYESMVYVYVEGAVYTHVK